MMTWVEPAATFFDRIEATDHLFESMPSGRVIAFITSSTAEWFSRPFQAMQPRAPATTRRTSSTERSTRAIVSIASAVPAADVMAREDVFGITSPCAATIGTTIMVMRLPGMPPIECLSTTIGSSQVSFSANDVRTRASATTSAVDRLRVAETRNAATSRSA